MKKQLIYRAIITPDGTVLSSKNRHDYKKHTDTVTGEEYMIDGGLDYFRTNKNKVKATIFEIYNTDNIKLIRENFERGTTDEKGNPIYKKLKDLSNQHVENIILYNTHKFLLNTNVEDLDESIIDVNTLNYIYLKELEYRIINDINIQ